MLILRLKEKGPAATSSRPPFGIADVCALTKSVMEGSGRSWMEESPPPKTRNSNTQEKRQGNETFGSERVFLVQNAFLVQGR